MTHLFISDLHLQPERPDITHGFLNFLTRRAKQAQALYILGDLFEVWLGDDMSPADYPQIITALQHLTTQGVNLFFMVGNRDFLIGEKFCQLTGATLLTEPWLLDLYGRPIVLMHGDALCTLDLSLIHI